MPSEQRTQTSQDGGRRPVRVLIFGTSLRDGSLNDRLATLAATVAEQQSAVVDRARMSDFDCPSYDQDVELGEGIPPGAHRFRERLVTADAFIIASPEYNASLPGAIKNTIDWASRFRPQPFNGRQALLLSASPSMAGGNRGLWALRIPLEHLGARVYPDIFSLSQAHEAFGADGRIANATLEKRFEDVIDCFLDLVEAAKHYRALDKLWIEYLGEQPNAATDRVEETPMGAA
jgi:chromate reductase, NAD(P)H dehydrogenase (quinone)